MPAAPATQPSPNTGIRLTSGRSPSLPASLASTEGAAMPVTEVNMIRSTSPGVSPAASSAAPTASAPRSTAASMKISLAIPNPSSLAYCSSGSTRLR